MSSWPLLSIVTFLPLAGALFIFLLGRAEGEAGDRNAKWVALWTTLATFAFAVMVWVQFDPANPGFQMVEEAPWLGGGVSYKMGVNMVLIAFVASVIGGMGSLVGAALGGFLVGIVSVSLQAYLPVDLRPYRDAFVFLAFIAFLLWRPQGIMFRRADRERV